MGSRTMKCPAPLDDGVRMPSLSDASTMPSSSAQTPAVNSPATGEASSATPGEPIAPVGPPLLSRFHALRKIADKGKRKLKRLAGKADKSPWIIRPSSTGGERAYVDFVFGLDYLSPNAPLVRLFKEAMGRLGLSFLLVNEHNIESVTRDVSRGWLRPLVYLDLASAIDRRFWTLLEAADRQGIYTVGKLSALPTWTIKASAQPLLEAAGLPLPPTVIFRKTDPDRDLTPDELARIGEKCVVKPSFGVSGKGAVVGVPSTAAAIRQARNYNRQDDWLVQKMIRWTRCGDRPAYLRAYNIFGHRSLMWWARDDGREWYDLLTWEDLHKYDLLPVVGLIDRLAEVTGMDFFSSEVAITAHTGPDRFVLIDYVNDQCDLDTEDGPNKRGIPEPWVAWVCAKCAEFVHARKHHQAPALGRSLQLF